MTSVPPVGPETMALRLHVQTAYLLKYLGSRYVSKYLSRCGSTRLTGHKPAPSHLDGLTPNYISSAHRFFCSRLRTVMLRKWSHDASPTLQGAVLQPAVCSSTSTISQGLASIHWPFSISRYLFIYTCRL